MRTFSENLEGIQSVFRRGLPPESSSIQWAHIVNSIDDYRGSSNSAPDSVIAKRLRDIVDEMQQHAPQRGEPLTMPDPSLHEPGLRQADSKISALIADLKSRRL